MKTNAAEFARQLQAELESEVAKSMVSMTRRIARHVRNRAEESSPVGTRRRPGAIALKNSWNVSVGEPELGKRKRGTDADAVANLQNLKPGEAVFVSSTDFTSSFIENGTVKMPPRPIVRAAIEETRSWTG